MTDDDDLFGWSMFNAIVAVYRMERPRVDAEEEPQPEAQASERPPLPKLPLGVQWVNPGRYWPSRRPPHVRPCTWITRSIKVYLPIMPSTEEGIEQAARAALAGRLARDGSASRDDIVAAMQEAL